MAGCVCVVKGVSLLAPDWSQGGVRMSPRSPVPLAEQGLSPLLRAPQEILHQPFLLGEAEES